MLSMSGRFFMQSTSFAVDHLTIFLYKSVPSAHDTISVTSMEAFYAGCL